MKIDHNHIDDLFREGLEDFTEVPRKGVWKRISGKLLWNEISHFNFSNVPALWTGIAATGLVVIALAVFLPGFYHTPDQITKTENISPDDPATPSRPEQPEPPAFTDREEKTADPVTANEDPATGITGEDAPARKPVTDDDAGTQTSESVQPLPAKEPATVPSAQRSTPEINKTEAVEADAGGKDIQTHKILEDTREPAQENAVENPAEISAEKETETPVQESGREVHELRPIEMVQPSLIAKDKSRDGEFAGNPDEIPVNLPEELMAMEAESKISGSGKIQKMHTLGFSIGQLLKGKYRPPKRAYTQSTMEMYRGTNSYFSVAVYAAPEVTEYTRLASTSKENNFLTGAAVSYHTSRYLVQAGVEFSRFNDLGDYMVNMKTYDSVGFYIDVGGFIIDPENPDSIVLQTHTVIVRDSVQHHSHQQTHNHYNYLQFPVLFGYKAMESGIFSAYLKAGPNFSFLLNKREPQLNFSRPDATIQGIDNYTLPRLNTSIQVLVSLSMQFQITEQVGILIEPTYRYYLNPVYDASGENLKNPYGIGARGGIYVNF